MRMLSELLHEEEEFLERDLAIAIHVGFVHFFSDEFLRESQLLCLFVPKKACAQHFGEGDVSIAIGVNVLEHKVHEELFLFFFRQDLHVKELEEFITVDHSVSVFVAPLDHHGPVRNGTTGSSTLLDLTQLNFTVLVHIEARKDLVLHLYREASGLAKVLLSICGPIDDSSFDGGYGSHSSDRDEVVHFKFKFNYSQRS